MFLYTKCSLADIVAMKTSQGEISLYWLPNHAEMLAEDWEVVE